MGEWFAAACESAANRSSPRRSPFEPSLFALRSEQAFLVCRQRGFVTSGCADRQVAPAPQGLLGTDKANRFDGKLEDARRLFGRRSCRVRLAQQTILARWFAAESM